MWTTPNFRERSADAEVTDVNLPPRICDPLVLPRMSSRSDVAPKTARPGRRGAVVTDITKRPRICDPLTLARTVRTGTAPPPRMEVTDVSSVPVGCNTSKGCHLKSLAARPSGQSSRGSLVCEPLYIRTHARTGVLKPMPGFARTCVLPMSSWLSALRISTAGPNDVCSHQHKAMSQGAPRGSKMQFFCSYAVPRCRTVWVSGRRRTLR